MRRIVFLLLSCILVGLLGGCTAFQSTSTLTPSELRYALPLPPQTLDPAMATDRASLDVIGLLYEGLTRYDPQRAEVVPAIAEAWDVSGNGLTYTFKLREGVPWINEKGDVRREVTADDVVYAIKRACDPATLSPTVSVLEIIKGCTPRSGQAGDVQIRALSPYIVEFTLTHPAAYFPLLMSLPVARPLPVEMPLGSGLLWNDTEQLLTNGPYRVQAWTANTQIVFLPNSQYYNAAKLPFTTISFVFTNEATLLTRYQSNQLDTIFAPSATPDEAPESEIHAEIEPCTYAYGFTLVKPPLDSARVRRALAYAIDRTVLTDQVLHMPYQPAIHFTPPGVVAGPTADTPGVSYNPKLARDYLSQAGYTDGEGFPPLSLTYPEGEEDAKVANAVAAMWQQTLGISVTLSSLPRDTYISTIQGKTPLTDMPHVWAMTWCAEFPDAYAWSHAAFNVSAPPTDLTGNLPPSLDSRATFHTGNNAPRRTATRFDEITAQAIAESDVATRRALYAAAEQLLLIDDAVVAPLYHYTNPVLTKSWLQRSYFTYAQQPFTLWKIDAAIKDSILKPEP